MVWIEPWGGDYTILPGQQMMVTVLDPHTKNDQWLTLVETEYNTQVFVEPGEYPEIQLDGCVVEEGHNRQAAISAGVYVDASNYKG